MYIKLVDYRTVRDEPCSYEPINTEIFMECDRIRAERFVFTDENEYALWAENFGNMYRPFGAGEMREERILVTVLHVIKDQEVVETVLLTNGGAYIMNDGGKTIDKH